MFPLASSRLRMLRTASPASTSQNMRQDSLGRNPPPEHEDRTRSLRTAYFYGDLPQVGESHGDWEPVNDLSNQLAAAVAPHGVERAIERRF